MSSNPLSILPHHEGSNLAPLAPLLKLGEGSKDASTSFDEAIKERFLHYRDLEKATWEEMISSGEEVAMFIQGKQFLMPNPFRAGGWLPYKVNSSGGNPAEKRALSVLQYHTSGNLEKWLNSNPDVRVRAGIESDDAQEAAEAARIVVDHYEEKFYHPRNTIAECLEGLTFGSYIWRLRLDSNLKSVTAYRQVFENREVKVGPGWGKCGECGHEGGFEDFNKVEDFYTCTKCHGEALVIEPATGMVEMETRREPVPLGDFRLDLVPFASCRWDLKHHADESPWMIIRRRTTVAAVRALVGNIELTGGGSSDTGLDTVDRLAYSGQAQAGWSNASQGKSLYKEAATVEEFWMSPAEYGDIILNQPVRTVDGQEIPSGVRLGDAFGGHSLCVLGLNEMSTVLGVYTEDHRDYVVQGKWYAKPQTGAGRGLQDLTEVQKVFNSDHQQIHTYNRGISTPAMLVASEILGEEGKSRYVGTPGLNIPVPLAKLAEGVTLDQLARPAFQMPLVPAQHFQFTYDRLSEFAQFASHFLPFASGMPGVDNTTATGANITQAATNALYTPVLSVKGEIRKLVAEKLTRLYPKAFPVERQFPLGGKYSRQSFKRLSGSQLDTELVFEVVADSWLPKNGYTKRQAYAAVAQMFGNVANWLQARKAEPKMVLGIERAFDLEDDGAEMDVAAQLCNRRVRQMAQAARVVPDPYMLVGVQQAVQTDPATGQQIPTPELVLTGQGAIQPPVSQAEPGHELKRQWFMEWLDADDGQEAEPALRQAVEVLIVLHTQLAGRQAQILAGQAGAVQVAGAQPGLQAQQEVQEAQAQQQLAQREEEMGLQAAEAIGAQAVAESEVENEVAREAVRNESAKERALVGAVDREHRLAVRADEEAMRTR